MTQIFLYVKMNVCRTCLASCVNKDISLLSEELEGEPRPYSDIMLFCLGIQVIPESKITSKLCEECFRNILSFHKFKKLAIKSNEYLQSLEEKVDKKDVFVGVNIKQEITVDYSDDINYDDIQEEPCIKLEIDVKEEKCLTDDDDDIKGDTDVKIELDFKNEDSVTELESDNELLSDKKQNKNELVTEEGKGNEPKKAIKKKKIKRKRDKNTEKPEQECKECGKTVRNLKHHMIQHQPPHLRKKYKCKECDQVFSSYSARGKHYRNKHLGMKKHCDECNKDYVNLSSHQKMVHKMELLSHECVLCGRRFVSPSKRDEHMLTHSKERPFPCDQCDSAFTCKAGLQSHKRQVHEKEKNYSCQFCSKSFFNKNHLQIHLRSHTKEKPYNCSECGKCFSSTATLKKHKLLHTDVKMFACQLCHMTFRTSWYLRDHMACHTDERRHACQYCGVAFRRPVHCRRHEKTVHEKYILPAA